ncbi:MAG: hypothetical protein R3310_05890 [Candidatus Competibacteraceae bacterium]|nr:hypothetical protein [Candidatus Competibacteraceae bacterium]
MAVIIEEFEVLPQETPSGESAGGETRRATPPPPSPVDIGDILRHQARRQRRLRAH